jgi:hypothetical protein
MQPLIFRAETLYLGGTRVLPIHTKRTLIFWSIPTFNTPEW